MLSQVVETITYRLLELEERLSLQESYLQDLQHQTVGSQQLSDGAELRFDDTEVRLGHLEALLNGLGSMPAAAGAARHLQPVTGGAGSYGAPAEEPSIDGLLSMPPIPSSSWWTRSSAPEGFEPAGGNFFAEVVCSAELKWPCQ
jgi:uncharacterized coiled-coil protein SlyX